MWILWLCHRKIIVGQDSSSWDYEWLYFMPICQMIVDVVSVVDQPHCHPKSHAASMAKKLYRYWPVIVILKSMAVQPQYNIVIVIQLIYFMTIHRYFHTSPTCLPWVWGIQCHMDLAQSLCGLWLCHRTVLCTTDRRPASDCLCYWSSLTHLWLHLGGNSRQTRGLNNGQLANYSIQISNFVFESSTCPK